MLDIYNIHVKHKIYLRNGADGVYEAALLLTHLDVWANQTRNPQTSRICNIQDLFGETGNNGCVSWVGADIVHI